MIDHNTIDVGKINAFECGLSEGLREEDDIEEEEDEASSPFFLASSRLSYNSETRLPKGLDFFSNKSPLRGII